MRYTRDWIESMGFRRGWADAALYATGTRADRAVIRRDLAKSDAGQWGRGPFWTAYRDAFDARAEAFGRAIAEGRIARTIRPTRLFALCNR